MDQQEKSLPSQLRHKTQNFGHDQYIPYYPTQPNLGSQQCLKLFSSKGTFKVMRYGQYGFKVITTKYSSLYSKYQQKPFILTAYTESGLRPTINLQSTFWSQIAVPKATQNPYVVRLVAKNERVSPYAFTFSLLNVFPELFTTLDEHGYYIDQTKNYPSISQLNLFVQNQVPYLKINSKEIINFPISSNPFLDFMKVTRATFFQQRYQQVFQFLTQNQDTENFINQLPDNQQQQMQQKYYDIKQFFGLKVRSLFQQYNDKLLLTYQGGVQNSQTRDFFNISEIVAQIVSVNKEIVRKRDTELLKIHKNVLSYLMVLIRNPKHNTFDNIKHQMGYFQKDIRYSQFISPLKELLAGDYNRFNHKLHEQKQGSNDLIFFQDQLNTVDKLIQQKTLPQRITASFKGPFKLTRGMGNQIILQTQAKCNIKTRNYIKELEKKIFEQKQQMTTIKTKHFKSVLTSIHQSQQYQYMKQQMIDLQKQQIMTRTRAISAFVTTFLAQKTSQMKEIFMKVNQNSREQYIKYINFIQFLYYRILAQYIVMVNTQQYSHMQTNHLHNKIVISFSPIMPYLYSSYKDNLRLKQRVKKKEMYQFDLPFQEKTIAPNIISNDNRLYLHHKYSHIKDETSRSLLIAYQHSAHIQNIFQKKMEMLNFNYIEFQQQLRQIQDQISNSTFSGLRQQAVQHLQLISAIKKIFKTQDYEDIKGIFTDRLMTLKKKTANQILHMLIKQKSTLYDLATSQQFALQKYRNVVLSLRKDRSISRNYDTKKLFQMAYFLHPNQYLQVVKLKNRTPQAIYSHVSATTTLQFSLQWLVFFQKQLFNFNMSKKKASRALLSDRLATFQYFYRLLRDVSAPLPKKLQEDLADLIEQLNLQIKTYNGILTMKTYEEPQAVFQTIKTYHKYFHDNLGKVANQINQQIANKNKMSSVQLAQLRLKIEMLMGSAMKDTTQDTFYAMEDSRLNNMRNHDFQRFKNCQTCLDIQTIFENENEMKEEDKQKQKVVAFCHFKVENVIKKCKLLENLINQIQRYEKADQNEKMVFQSEYKKIKSELQLQIVQLQTKLELQFSRSGEITSKLEQLFDKWSAFQRQLKTAQQEYNQNDAPQSLQVKKLAFQGVYTKNRLQFKTVYSELTIEGLQSRENIKTIMEQIEDLRQKIQIFDLKSASYKVQQYVDEKMIARASKMQYLLQKQYRTLLDYQLRLGNCILTVAQLYSTYQQNPTNIMYLASIAQKLGFGQTFQQLKHRHFENPGQFYLSFERILIIALKNFDQLSISRKMNGIGSKQHQMLDKFASIQNQNAELVKRHKQMSKCVFQNYTRYIHRFQLGIGSLKTGFKAAVNNLMTQGAIVPRYHDQAKKIFQVVQYFFTTTDQLLKNGTHLTQCNLQYTLKQFETIFRNITTVQNKEGQMAFDNQIRYQGVKQRFLSFLFILGKKFNLQAPQQMIEDLKQMGLYEDGKHNMSNTITQILNNVMIDYE